MSEPLARTPLYEEHLALGARMVPFAGYEMPVQYAGIKEEHEAVRSSAGVFDVCHMSEFRVFGFGAFDFLQGLLTNDLSRIAEVGSAQYTLMCDEDGGIIDDLIVYHTGDLEYLIIANAANRHHRSRLAARALPRGCDSHRRCRAEHRRGCGIVELADESDRTGLIAVQGPRRSASSRAGRARVRAPGASTSPRRGWTRCPSCSPGPATPARTASRSSVMRLTLPASGACC
jgi:aminomethyltransferase